MDTGNPSLYQADGQKAYASGDFSGAARFFERASEAYKEVNDPLSAAEMANNRSVVLLKMGLTKEALAAVEGTDAVFASAGDLRRQATALGNKAAVVDALGDRKSALAYYNQAADLFKKLGDQEMRSYILRETSAVYLRTGKYIEALASMQTALDIKKNLSFREKILHRILRIPFQMLGSG